MSLDDEILFFAVENALQHGKALPSPVMNAMLSAHPELRGEAKSLYQKVNEVVRQVNGKDSAELAELEKKLLLSNPSLAIKKKEETPQERTLPPLEGASKGAVVTRFAPNPDAPIHLGNARALVLSAEYARLYEGRFVLRFEDTDPHVKPPMPEAYDWIREDVKWLGYKWDLEWIQSQHLSNYYDVVRELIRREKAYVCTCSAEHFQELRRLGESCPHRGEKVDEALELFERMVAGEFKEGEAVVRMRTDMRHPNPALRDFPLMRVVDPNLHPHPMLKNPTWAFPLYNLSAAVDDHLLGITHVLRGKEHLTNEEAQAYIYDAMGWKRPISVQHGRLMLEGIPLSKSQVKKALSGGAYNGWDDPRLGTLMALRRRGFSPRAIIDLILEVGPKPTDATVSWDNLYAMNRKYLEPISHRYFVVRNPIEIAVEGLGERVVTLPLHPDHPEMGSRNIAVTCGKVFVQSDDVKEGQTVRLMELATITYLGSGRAKLEDISPEKSVEEGIKRVQWVPEEFMKVSVVSPEGTFEALAEHNLSLEPVNATIQMVRWGFARVDAYSSDRRSAVLYFAHK
ncbi:MAG: glutamate--tRNA ligase [Thermoprotei archaeon]|nr:glutamate--tRNA ligase [TACK group archaeon]